MFNNKWDSILSDEMKKEYFINLISFIDAEYDNKVCYPQYNEIFNSLKLTDYDSVKVVILGQDPYHGEGEAHGLAFSVKNNVKCPPSLNNIFKELYNDLGILKSNNDLTGWARQGVLLLNSILTVEKDKPLSHKNKGWEIFTDSIIKKLNEREDPIVFVLWGRYAQSKKGLINNQQHFIVSSPHPSPLSAYNGFFYSSPFTKINSFLEKNNYTTIDFKK